jgi:hypothetical protein
MDLKYAPGTRARALAAGVVDDGERHQIWVAEPELPDDGMESAWRFFRYAAGEIEAVAADIVSSHTSYSHTSYSHTSGRHATFLTGTGELVHVDAGSLSLLRPFPAGGDGKICGNRIELAVIAGRVCAFAASESEGVQPAFLEKSMDQ